MSVLFPSSTLPQVMTRSRSCRSSLAIGAAMAAPEAGGVKPSKVSIALLSFHARRAVAVDQPALPFRCGRAPQLPQQRRQICSLALDGARQRKAAQGPEAHHAPHRRVAGLEL